MQSTNQRQTTNVINANERKSITGKINRKNKKIGNYSQKVQNKVLSARLISELTRISLESKNNA